MKTDIEIVTQALALFQDDGTIVASKAQDLLGDVHLMAHVSKDPRLDVLRRHLFAANQDFWNISILIHRLDWFRTQRPETTEPFDPIWFHYTQLDIQTFHVEIRSIFDYLAASVVVLSPKPKTMPTSFRGLLKWAENNPKRISPTVRDLLLEQRDWFMDLRSIRDQLIHNGGQPIVFGKPSEGIQFQIYRPQHAPHIIQPGIMYNDNVAYFDRYAALIIARVLCFMENLAIPLRNMAGLPSGPGCVQSSAMGHAVIRQWLENLQAILTM